MNKLIKKADVLIEALLPHIRTFKGQNRGHQVRGHAMTDASLKARFAECRVAEVRRLEPRGRAWRRSTN